MKLLGPKTEAQKRIYFQSVAASIPRARSPNYDDSISDLEMKYFHLYFWDVPQVTSFGLEFDLVRRLEWLTFGCNSPCLINTLLPHALSVHKFKMSRTYELNDVELQQVQDYRTRSFSHLRLAISQKQLMEVFFTGLYLLNLPLRLGSWYYALFEVDRHAHFSGLWATLKELYFDPSVSDKQWSNCPAIIVRHLTTLRSHLSKLYSYHVPTTRLPAGPTNHPQDNN
jgi:hypothetical protein